MASTRSFDCADLEQHLNDVWRAALIKADHTLNKAALDRNIRRRKQIPRAFINAFNAKFTTNQIQEYTPAETSSSANPVKTKRPNRGPSTPPATAEEEVTDDEEEDPIGTERDRKRAKFTWLLDTWAGESDDYNPRNLDGTLRAIENYSGAYTEAGIEINPEGQTDLPPGFLTDEFMEAWERLYEVNGKIAYDPENLAVGGLEPREYFIIPSNFRIPMCSIDDVGLGLNKFKVPIPTIAAIYVLAKRQAVELNLRGDDQVKWAILRLEAFKAGWFDNQKFTMRKKAPDNCMSLMLADRTIYEKYMKDAYALCAFIPFMAEFFFRTYGSAYNRNNAAEYIGKANKFAESSNLPDLLNYMDADCLFGKVLAWIGMKRAMLVLTRRERKEIIPSPFMIRAYGAPAGAAVVTTSMAVIHSIESAGWWEVIKQIARYDDAMLRACAEKVAANPWAYHIMSNVYGVAGLSAEDATEFAKAKDDATKFAPILQAYLDTVVLSTPLSKAKSLSKHADTNKKIYQAAKTLFRGVAKGKVVTIQEVFGNEAFRLTGPGDDAVRENRDA